MNERQLSAIMTVKNIETVFFVDFIVSSPFSSFLFPHAAVTMLTVNQLFTFKTEQ